MKKTMLALALVSLGTVANAQTAFSVNGQTISANAQKNIMTQLEARGVADKKQQENMARALLIEQTVISQEARKQKIDQLPAVKEELAALKHRVYVNELLKKNVLDKKPTDKEINALYERAKDNYDPHEVKISHILVKDESEARDLIKQIQGGADFAKLAKEKSLDQATAKNGGGLPMVNVRQLQLPGLAEAAVSLNKGQLLAIPFKGTSGYHVVRLDDKKEVPFPSEADLKDQLVNIWKQEQSVKYLRELVQKAKISTAKGK